MNYTKNQLSIAKIRASTGRREITGVLLDGTKAVATDSYRLIEMTNKNATGKEPSFIINGDYLVKSLPAFGKETSCRIFKDTDGNNAIIEIGTATNRLPIIGESSEYPDYKKIIPDKKPKAVIRLNATYLKELCDILEHIGSLKEIEMSVYEDNEPIMFTVENKEEKALALLMPLRK